MLLDSIEGFRKVNFGNEMTVSCSGFSYRMEDFLSDDKIV